MLVDPLQQKLAYVLSNSTNITSKEINSIPVESIVENGMVSVFLNRVKSIKYKEIVKLKEIDKQLIVINEIQRQCFEKVFNSLSTNAVPYSVLKGWALSYSCYPKPHERPKTDIDILIPEEEKERVKEIFYDLGYTNPRGWEPKAIIDQYSMRKVIVKGIYANVDVHLKLTNDKVLQSLFNFSEIMLNSSLNRKLGTVTVDPPLALIHAIIHLLHHACNADYLKLIWFYDIYLIIKGLSKSQVSVFLGEVDKAELANPVCHALLKQQELFPSESTKNMIFKLQYLNSNDKYNYLMAAPSRLKLMLRNFKETKGLKGKLLVIQETFFPPKEEIYLKYGKHSKSPLLLLYFRRIISGVFRHLKF